MDVEEASDACGLVLDAVGEAVVADREFLETVLTAVLARGHALLEDVPGTGKTLTARSVAAALGLEFSRVQFTPDLLPGDVTGTNVYNERDDRFEFREGPVFANVVLADEINRAPPKTQAALLEAMEEEQVTVDGEPHALPTPFFVIATQNPVESEGSLHPDETVYMNGRLWRAGDALKHARENGRLIHDGDTRLYDLDATTETLTVDGEMAETDCLVYETEYEGEMYTVRTKTGRKTRVSGNHPFLVNRSGVLEWIEAADLRTDDVLVTPSELGSPNGSLPEHDEVVDALDDVDGFTVVPRERATLLGRRLDTLDTGESLAPDSADDLRITAELSKKDLAERLDASYDQLLHYLDGADNGLSTQVVDALSALEITVADYVESHRISRFRTPFSEEEAGFFVAFLLSDGHYTDSSVRVYQKNSPELFDHWVRLAEKLGFDPRIRDIRGGRQAAIASRPLVEYLDRRYSLRTPESLLSAPEGFRETFLETFLLAESNFDVDQRRITFAQKDRETTNLIAYLLLQFGFTPRLKRRPDGGFEIRIQGQDVLAYLERFEWPGEEPSTESLEDGHRSVPVSASQFRGIIDRLGIPHEGAMAERSWYNGYRSLGDGATAVSGAQVEAFVDDMRPDVDARAAADGGWSAEHDVSTAASRCRLAITDIVDGTDLTKHRVSQSYEGYAPPEAAVEFVTDPYDKHIHEAETLTPYLRELVSSEVLYDPITDVESEPYDGTVIGLTVPGTHNYVAGFGAFGINHNTFPLPEAQVDRFAVKTAIGYPDEQGELDLLRRRAGRAARAPTVEPVLDSAAVTAIREVPETVRVDEDLLRYMTGLTRETRRDRRVRVGVSPRGTQRLFEAARAVATLRGRGYVTPDDVKWIAQPVLAHRLVLTADAKVAEVEKREVIADVLDEIPVPTV